MSVSLLPVTGTPTTRGFTLVELLTVLAIVAVLVTVGVPLYGNYSRDAAVSGTASGLAAALGDARARAVAERTAVQVRAIDGDWRNGWQTVRINKQNDPADDEVLFIDRRAGDGGEVVIDESTAAPAIDFGPEGRVAVPRNFRIGIRGGAKGMPMRTLAVNPLGRIDVGQALHP